MQKVEEKLLQSYANVLQQEKERAFSAGQKLLAERLSEQNRKNELILRRYEARQERAEAKRAAFTEAGQEKGGKS